MRTMLKKNSILTALLLGGAIAAICPIHAAFGNKGLQVQSLRDKVYRLESGPINRCPEKLGFQLNNKATEILLYPMEVEWEKIRTHVSPVVVVRGLRHSWESHYEEVSQAGNTKSTYAAVLEENSIDAVTRTRIEESMLIESHAKLEFLRDRLRMIRWSTSAGMPLSENLLCAYREESILKTAQNIAR